MTLSSPPVAGVWWEHTLDWLYVSLSSPPLAGVWWAHTLDWLYVSLSSPPLAGVWWAHWRRCPVAAVASSNCTPHPPHPQHDCKALWVYRNTQLSAMYMHYSFFHSFIHSFIRGQREMRCCVCAQRESSESCLDPWPKTSGAAVTSSESMTDIKWNLISICS